MIKSEKILTVNGRDFSSKNPLIIAELGTSHNGDMTKAKEMIDAAGQAGAYCVKFQMVYTDEILHPNTGEVPLPGGKIRLYDRFKALELESEFYQNIKEYSESKGLLFLCTPFGLKSASILQGMHPKLIKIASPELNFTGLLEEIARWGLPVLLSSGVSRLSDIETAIDLLKKEFSQRRIEPSVRGAEDAKERKGEEIQPSSSICLLHCVTAYPAPETDYNLRVLASLSSVFGVPVGVSDHSLDPQLVPALAVGLGAVAIEKHFCLSRSDPGLDDPIALEPDDFSKMVKSIQQAAKDGYEKTVERYSKQNGAELVRRILGNGVKELAPSEKENYTRTNSSIHALRDIKAGEILKKSDYAVLRTEKILRPGLEPCYENMIEGRTAKNFIPAGEGIRFEDI